MLLKIKIVTKKGKIADMNTLIESVKPDLIVATAQTSERNDIKVFSGVPLISTLGQDKLYDDIFAYIKEQDLG